MTRILLVEDQNSFVFKELLHLLDDSLTVDTAPDGVEALRLVSKNKYDAILLDIRIPKMDGLGVLDELRQSDAKTPVIIITAYGLKSTRDKAARLGANAFFTKPFNHEKLYREMIRLIADRRVEQRHESVVANLERRLRGLEEKKALLGYDAPVALDLEIETVQKEIETYRYRR